MKKLLLVTGLGFLVGNGWGAKPVLIDADEAAKQKIGVELSQGWTSKYTTRQMAKQAKPKLAGLSGAEKQEAKDQKREIQEYDVKTCDVTPPGFQARPNLYLDNDFTTSGMGYGADGGDEGAEEWIELTTKPGVRSVSALFLNHRDGQVAEVFVDGKKLKTINTYSRGGDPSGATKGVCGQIMEEVIATELSAGEHKIRIVNTGKVDGAADYKGRTDRGVGRQVILDCFRTGDFDFGTVEGMVTDREGKPLPQVRMLVNSDVGPIVEDGKTVIFTNGDGKYRLSGLERGKAYGIASDDRRVNIAEELMVPAEGNGVLVKNFDGANNVNVMRPRMGAPAIVKRGDSMSLEVDAVESASDWAIKIKNADITIDVPVVSAEFAPGNVYNNTRAGWVISAKVPDSGITHEDKGAPCELYDIEVSCSLGTRMEARAVSVIESYDTDFYLAQITDTHLFGGKGNLQKNLEVLDIIAPRFIAITGDLVQLPGQPQLFEIFLDTVKEEAETACVFTTGNHDVTIKFDAFQLELWDTLFAQRDYSFRMGPVYVLNHNVTTPTKDWVDAEWNRTHANANDKVRVVVQHSARAFDGFAPPKGKPATIVLGGHNHKDTGSVVEGTPIVTTAATGGALRGRIVRFDVDEAGEWKMRSFAYPNKAVTEGAKLEEYPSVPFYGTGAKIPKNDKAPEGEKAGVAAEDTNPPNLTRTFSAANDGASAKNSVTIENKTLEPFEYCRARFVMAKGAYKVASGTGRIIHSYNSTHGSTIVLTEIPVDPQSASSLEIVKE